MGSLDDDLMLLSVRSTKINMSDPKSPPTDPRLSPDYEPPTNVPVVSVRTVVVPNAPKPDNNYWVNASNVDQGLLGPDDQSRVIPPKSYVHGSQSKVPGLLTRAAGTFVKMRKVERLKQLIADGNGTVLVIGGPLNNAKGSFVPRG